jgi:hypothetical protein
MLKGWVFGGCGLIWLSCASCGSSDKGPDNGGVAGFTLIGAGGSSAGTSSSAGSGGFATAGAAGGSDAPCVGNCPVDLVTGLDSPFGLAVNDSHIYILMLKLGGVVRAPISGGATEVVATVQYGSTGSDGLALDATSVYFTNSGGGTQSGVLKTSLAPGGSVDNLAIGTSAPDALLVDQTNVYFSGDEIISKVPIAGGPAVILVDTRPRHTSPRQFVLAADYLYWTQASDSGDAVMRVAKAGGDAETLVKGELVTTSLAVDADNVYFLAYGDLKKVPVAGGASSVVVAGFAGTGGQLALDGDTLYATNNKSKSIVKVNKAGGTPTVVAAAPSPRSLTFDATHLYWIERMGSLSENSAVRSIAK